MFSYNNKISIRQFQILVLLDIFGTGIIILPRITAVYAAQDGWVLVLLATLFALAYTFVITSLAQRFPDKNFVEMVSIIVGKPLGYVISFVFMVKIILMMAYQLRFFVEITRQTILMKTPFWIIIGSILLMSAYAAMKGMETRARLAEILIVLIMVPLLIVFFISATDVDYSNLLPVLRTPKSPYLYGAYMVSFSFSGIELSILANPFVKDSKKIRGALLKVILLLGVFYLLITIITIARFGAKDLLKQMWPVLEMMDTIDIPGSFIERQEALVMSFWILSVFAFINAGLFFSSLLARDLVKKGKHSLYILLCIPVIFWIAYLPKDIFQVNDWIVMVNTTLGIAYLFFIPFVLWMIACLRGLGVRP